MSIPPSVDPVIELDDRGLTVGGREVPMYSGAMHYWRIDRDAWRPALVALKDMGLTVVETYAPWSVHELGPGQYDFGESDPRKDLGAFLDLIAEEDLWAFVRPGPHINAELTHFGIPERVIYDRRCQARSPEQNPVLLYFPPKMFPVPSYASEAYFAEVERWYQRVGSIVSRRIYPEGPVILLQVDNEAAYYFRGSAYDQDYHPDAITRWHAFVEHKYGDLAYANAAHAREYSDWAAIEPPVRFDANEPRALVRHLDWSRFQEHLITTGLSRLRDIMASAGMSGTPVMHNLPPGDLSAPVHVPDLQREIGLVGLDYYHRASDYETIKRRTLYLAGTVPLPYSPELGAGIPAWFTPSTDADSLFCAMTACAHGLRGFNMYMAVGRDRWVGGPIDARGEPRPAMQDWKKLLTALARTRFVRLHQPVQTAIVLPREYVRLSRATHLFGPLSATVIEMLTGHAFGTSRGGKLGFDHEIQLQWWRAAQQAAQTLKALGVPYHYIDSEAQEARWREYELLCCPTFDFIGTHTWRRLKDAEARGARVVHGPATPELDDSMNQTNFDPIGSALRVDWSSSETTTQALKHLVESLQLARPYSASPATIETCVHREGDRDRVLFVIQPDNAPEVAAEITVPYPMQLTDSLTREIFEARDTLTLPMRGRSCRMLEIEPTATESSQGWP